MASEYKGLCVTFEGNSTKLTAALAEVNSEARKAQGQLRGVQGALRLDPTSTKLLGEAVKATGSKVEATKRRVDMLRQAQDELAKSGDTTSAVYQRVSRELAQAEAYLRRDQRALVDATYAASGFAKAADGLSSFGAVAKGVGDGLSSVGGRLTAGVTVPLAAVATACVSSAVTIDSALTDVRKTTDLTEEQYQSLKASAVELSKAQPVDASTILSLEGLSAQLGWCDDKLQDFAQTVSGLDIATDMDADTAATNLAQFANVTGMAQGQAENYASAIVGLGNNMATTESKISDMSMGMASAGTQAGMSQADILGIAAATASLGMEAQAGGTAFSKTVNEIGVQVSTNGKELQEWAALARMSMDEFKSAWQTDATGTFEAVIRGMSDAQASGEDLNVILSDLGITETRQSDFLRRLAGNAGLVTRAVSLSNDEWSKNTALQDEVSNRNDSLASKAEVLKNRVTAVTDELGGPLADAALDAVDAAKPITDSIEGAAKAFSSMSKEEQGAVIQTAAMAAAAGPLLAIGGKAVSAIGTVTGGLGKAVKAVGEVRSATKILGSFGDALDLLDLKGAAVAGGVGLAVAAVAALGAKAYDSWKTERDFGAALDDMADSSEEASSRLAGGSRSIAGWGGMARDAAMDTKELTSAIREHNDAMESIRDRAYDSIDMLGQYQAVIDRLAGRGEASAEDTAMLEWALKGLNDALDTSYTAADVLTGEYEDQSGAIVSLRGEIDGLIKKKQEEARVNATQELYTEALRNQLEMQKNATAAQREYDDAWQRYYDDAMKLPGMTEEAAKAAATISAQTDGYKKKLDDASDSLSVATEETGEWAEQMGLAQVACTDAGAAMSDFLSGTDGWADALSNTGFSLEELAGAAASAGISTDALASMGSDAFARLAESAGGDIGTLMQMLGTLNSLGLDPKTFTVGDDGTITDEAGKVWDLDAMTIDGKIFTVNDDGTVSVEQAGVDHLSATEVASKSFGVTSNGTTQTETGNVSDLRAKLDMVPGTYTATVSTSGVATASSGVQGLLDKLSTLAGTAWTAAVHVLTGNAAGGVRLRASGGVRLHAAGAVYTGPTMVTPRDVIGEDGAEYYDGTHIVPLTNRRYSQPFADIIAEGVAGRIGAAGGRTVVQNVTQNVYEREDIYVAGTVMSRALMSAAQGV
ncbi:MAG: phage tail tape measure protein [Coriobacteriaceae bacterium]|nr:phage tail tape measure protein [Coriobacteriaceae bacterium]